MKVCQLGQLKGKNPVLKMLLTHKEEALDFPGLGLVDCVCGLLNFEALIQEKD